MGRVIRGTTPYHRFKLPISPDIIDKIYVTYSQSETIKIEKAKEDMQFITIEGDPVIYKAVIHLTQEDTLNFVYSYPSSDPVEIQMDIKTSTGERIISTVLKTSVGKVLKDEEI